MTEVLDLIGADRITRASMFALELVDPITDKPVTSGLVVTAKGLGPPIRTYSGRYAWSDNAPPVPRVIEVNAVSTDGRYAEFNESIQVPAHLKDTKPAALLFRKLLTATGLYVPPDGATAFAGQLLAGTGDPPVGLKGVAIELVLRCERDADGHEVATSKYAANSDDRGGFVAVFRGHNNRVPKLRKFGSPAGFLQFRFPNREPRFSDLLPLGMGRLVYARDRLVWDRLGLEAPELPDDNGTGDGS